MDTASTKKEVVPDTKEGLFSCFACDQRSQLRKVAAALCLNAHPAVQFFRLSVEQIIQVDHSRTQYGLSPAVFEAFLAWISALSRARPVVFAALIENATVRQSLVSLCLKGLNTSSSGKASEAMTLFLKDVCRITEKAGQQLPISSEAIVEEFIVSISELGTDSKAMYNALNILANCQKPCMILMEFFKKKPELAEKFQTRAIQCNREASDYHKATPVAACCGAVLLNGTMWCADTSKVFVKSFLNLLLEDAEEDFNSSLYHRMVTIYPTFPFVISDQYPYVLLPQTSLDFTLKAVHPEKIFVEKVERALQLNPESEARDFLLAFESLVDLFPSVVRLAETFTDGDLERLTNAAKKLLNDSRCQGDPSLYYGPLRRTIVFCVSFANVSSCYLGQKIVLQALTAFVDAIQPSQRVTFFALASVDKKTENIDEWHSVRRTPEDVYRILLNLIDNPFSEIKRLALNLLRAFFTDLVTPCEFMGKRCSETLLYIEEVVNADMWANGKPRELLTAVHLFLLNDRTCKMGLTVLHGLLEKQEDWNFRHLLFTRFFMQNCGEAVLLISDARDRVTQTIGRKLAEAYPLVCKDAPEGDFVYDGFEDDNEAELEGHTVMTEAYLNVREATQLLSVMCDPETCTLLWIETAYHTLRDCLLRTRHRGAFEQTHVALAAFMDKVWRSPMSMTLLPQWHRNALADVRSEADVMPVSRRSGGLPFLIKALMPPRETVKEKDHQFFPLKVTVNFLMNQIRESTRDSHIRIHCYHILASLLRDHRNAKGIGMFLSDLIKLPFSVDAGTSYLEENATNLFLRALIPRIFGQGEDKTMTAKAFLEEFDVSGLFQRFLDNPGNKPRSHLYTTLLLLAKIRATPSTLEFMEPFRPLLLRTMQHDEHGIRVAAFEALVCTYLPGDYDLMLLDTLRLLQRKETSVNFQAAALTGMTKFLDENSEILRDPGSKEHIAGCVQEKLDSLFGLNDVVGWALLHLVASLTAYTGVKFSFKSRIPDTKSRSFQCAYFSAIVLNCETQDVEGIIEDFLTKCEADVDSLLLAFSVFSQRHVVEVRNYYVGIPLFRKDFTPSIPFLIKIFQDNFLSVPKVGLASCVLALRDLQEPSPELHKMVQTWINESKYSVNYRAAAVVVAASNHWFHLAPFRTAATLLVDQDLSDDIKFALSSTFSDIVKHSTDRLSAWYEAKMLCDLLVQLVDEDRSFWAVLEGHGSEVLFHVLIHLAEALHATPDRGLFPSEMDRGALGMTFHRVLCHVQKKQWSPTSIKRKWPTENLHSDKFWHRAALRLFSEEQ